MPPPRVPPFTTAGEAVRRVLAGLNPAPDGDCNGTEAQGPDGVRGHVAGEAPGDRAQGRLERGAREPLLLEEPGPGCICRQAGRGSLARRWTSGCGLTADGRLLGLDLWVWAAAALTAIACHLDLISKGY